MEIHNTCENNTTDSIFVGENNQQAFLILITLLVPQISITNLEIADPKFERLSLYWQLYDRGKV